MNRTWGMNRREFVSITYPLVPHDMAGNAMYLMLFFFATIKLFLKINLIIQNVSVKSSNDSEPKYKME
jgi:hypothetical protein